MKSIKPIFLAIAAVIFLSSCNQQKPTAIAFDTLKEKINALLYDSTEYENVVVKGKCTNGKEEINVETTFKWNDDDKEYVAISGNTKYDSSIANSLLSSNGKLFIFNYITFGYSEPICTKNPYSCECTSARGHVDKIIWNNDIFVPTSFRCHDVLASPEGGAPIVITMNINSIENSGKEYHYNVV